MSSRARFNSNQYQLKIKNLVARAPSLDQLHISGSTIKSTNPHVKIDLGGYAKGYALDQASKIIHEHHIKNVLINIGGNIMAIGQHGNKPWRVGIQDPRGSQAIAKLDLPDGWVIGTSGDYQRYFINDGIIENNNIIDFFIDLINKKCNQFD